MSAPTFETLTPHAVPATDTALGRAVTLRANMLDERDRAERRQREWEMALALSAQLDPDEEQGEPDVREHDGQIVLVIGGLVFGCLAQPDETARPRGRVLSADEETGDWVWSWPPVSDPEDLAKECPDLEVPDLDAIGIPAQLPEAPTEGKHPRQRSAEERAAAALEQIAETLSWGIDCLRHR